MKKHVTVHFGMLSNLFHEKFAALQFHVFWQTLGLVWTPFGRKGRRKLDDFCILPEAISQHTVYIKVQSW